MRGLRRVLGACAVVLGAGSAAHADPISMNIATCSQGDCAAFAQSGGGSVAASLQVVDGTDLLITLTNNLRADAADDDPFLTNLGFEYAGHLRGLTFDRFAVLSGAVFQPTFVVDSAIRTFFIDFGFGFSAVSNGTNGHGRFQRGETVQMLIGTSGVVDIDEFTLGVAKVAGAGDGARSGGIVLTGGQIARVPEPGSFAALVIGLGAICLRRRRPSL